MTGQATDDWTRRLTEIRQLMAEQAASLDASGDFPATISRICASAAFCASPCRSSTAERGPV